MRERLNRDEQTALMDIAAIVTLTRNGFLGHLDRLLAQIPGGKRDMGLLRAKSLKLFESLCDVTPPDTLKAMLPTLKHVKVRIGVPLIGHESDCDKEMGVVVSYEDLTEIVAGCRDKCMLCDYSGAQISKCKLRKAFQHLPSADEPEPLGGGCGYKRLLMEDDYNERCK